jgi:hypothetical protein
VGAKLKGLDRSLKERRAKNKKGLYAPLLPFAGAMSKTRVNLHPAENQVK